MKKRLLITWWKHLLENLKQTESEASDKPNN